MSSSTVERRGPIVDGKPPPTGTLWERCAAMILLWIIPVVAFALAVFYGGAHGS